MTTFRSKSIKKLGDVEKRQLKEGLEKIHNHIEYCINHFESANDNNQEIPVHSYKMVLYELSEMTKNLSTSE